MAEHRRNLKAARTLDVHKKAIWALYEALELVGSGLLIGGRVEKIDRHFETKGYLICDADIKEWQWRNCC